MSELTKLMVNNLVKLAREGWGNESCQLVLWPNPHLKACVSLELIEKVEARTHHMGGERWLLRMTPAGWVAIREAGRASDVPFPKRTVVRANIGKRISPGNGRTAYVALKCGHTTTTPACKMPTVGKDVRCVSCWSAKFVPGFGR